MSMPIRSPLAGPARTPMPVLLRPQDLRSLLSEPRPLKRFVHSTSPTQFPLWKKPGFLVPGMIGTTAYPRSSRRSECCSKGPIASSQCRLVIEDLAAQDVLVVGEQLAQEL